MVTIGSLCLGACISIQFRCPGGCRCDKTNDYINPKYNIDCKQDGNAHKAGKINLAELNSECIKHRVFKINVTRGQSFDPVLSLCGLHGNCSMKLYLDMTEHTRFDFRISKFNITCPQHLTGLILTGNGGTERIYSDENPSSFPTGKTAYGERGHRGGEPEFDAAPGEAILVNRGHDWKMEYLESTGSYFKDNCIPENLLMNLHNLKKLNLSSNHIKKIRDKTFSEAGLNKLATIDLHKNYISSIPRDLFKSLPSIKFIDLSQNEIVYLSNSPFCSDTIKTLKQINLSHNTISGLPSNVFCNLSNLEHVHFCYNQIVNIDPDLMDSASLSKLRSITFSHNRIEYFPKLNFNRFVLQNLDKLDLSSNKLDQLNINITSFCQLPRINEINLSSNRISKIDTSSFNDTISFFNYTRNSGFKLNLDGNKLEKLNTDDFMSPLFDNLEELSMQANLLDGILDNTKNWTHPGHFHITINLSSNRLKRVPNGLCRHFPSLRRLILRGNKIKQIQEDALAVYNLSAVDLAYNEISEIHTNAFRSAQSLQYINLSGNMLTSVNTGTFQNLTYLRRLDISQNRLSMLFPLSFNYIPDNLVVDLRNNNITSVDIVTLGLSANTSQDQSESRKKRSTVPNKKCTVKLEGNRVSQITNTHYNNTDWSPPLCHVEFDRNYIINPDSLLQTLPSKASSVSTSDTSLMLFISKRLSANFWCTCFVYNYVKLLNETSMDIQVYNRTVCYMPSGTSSVPLPVEGSRFLDPSPNTKGVNLRCRIENCTNSVKCICLYMLESKETLVNCTKAELHYFPNIYINNTGINMNLSSNNINHIPNQRCLLKIKTLDLSYNNITNISEALPVLKNIKHLNFSHNLVSTRTALLDVLSLPMLETIYLAGNPFMCDCEGTAIKQYLLENLRIIKDIHAIKCIGTDLIEQVIIQIKTFNCSRGLPSNLTQKEEESSSVNIYMPIMVASIVLTVIIVLLALMYRNKSYIEIFLFSRFGFRFGSEYTNEKKLYDVFISHSSLDSDWVLDTLLPRLENNQPPFRVTVHQRDFLPGNSILNNIAYAITNTKAVILVVSNHFIESEWCKFEFREAVTEAIKMKYPKIIVVLLEQIKTDKIVGEELLFYLRTHTYVEWNSSYFWPRLLMSLPEPSNSYKEANCALYKKASIGKADTGI